MSTVETRQLTLAAARLLGWERCFEASIWMASIKVCASVTADERGEVTVRLTITVFGRSYVIEHTFNGNQCLEIAIVSGVALKICVLNWRINEDSVMFKLTLGVTLLGYPITLFEGEISVPIPVVEELERLTEAQVSSPQELAHLLALLGSVQLTELSDAGAAGAGVGAQPCRCGGGAEPARDPCEAASPYAGSCYFEGQPTPALMTCRRCCAAGGESWRGPNGELVTCR